MIFFNSRLAILQTNIFLGVKLRHTRFRVDPEEIKSNMDEAGKNSSDKDEVIEWLEKLKK